MSYFLERMLRERERERGEKKKRSWGDFFLSKLILHFFSDG